MELKLILLTGATGYVGGRLLTELVHAGYRVRCLARRPANLRQRVPTGVEVVAGDLLDAGSLAAAFTGVAVAYYLVHSMGSAGDFEEQDREAALNFGAAAKAAGVERIIYLGGLGEGTEGLSPHLRSRHEVGTILRESGVPVIELRASIIIGSGSLSFEMIRALVERLPVMVTPRWVRVCAQPIFINDVLAYLVAAATWDLPGCHSEQSEESQTGRSEILRFAQVDKMKGNFIFEIGGPDVVSYGELMHEYARQRGLRRLMIPVPVLTPRLSSLWLGLVTPLYARIGRKLIDSICHPTVVRDDAARRAFSIEPVGMRDAIAQALRNEDRECAQTRWSDAVSATGHAHHWGGERFGNRLVDVRSITVPVSPAQAFAPIERIGGPTGWYYADCLWTLRGWMDLAVGGVGMRRGRRDPSKLHVGDIVDCWRVDTIAPGRRLLLAAEMKLPGRAWLEFVVEPAETGAVIRQTAIFDPVGLWGLFYWYAVWPLHQLVFAGMLREISRASRQRL